MQKYILPDKKCPKCERLCAFHAQNRQKFPEFYNGAVPSFGALAAEFLVVGLAPGLKGANATGRPFTGDYAGDVLYPALITAGFAKGEFKKRADDGLELINARITNAVRCVPPENKPTTQEIAECNPFLLEEMQAMPNLKLILTLGLVSHKAVLKALGQKQSAFKFGHGNVHSIDTKRGGQQADPMSSEALAKEEAISPRSGSPLGEQEASAGAINILNSYHTSRYNVNTGRLTFEMFDEIISKAKTLLAHQRKSCA